MVDYRYHLASLAAMFLALGIGILIGNAFVGQTSANWQQSTLENIRREVAQVQQRSERVLRQDQELRSLVQKRDQGERSLAKALVSGVLQGRRVALVASGGMEKSEALGQMASLLGAAGAEVLTTSYVPDGWLPNDPATRKHLLERLQVVEDTPSELPGTASAALARALVGGIWSQALRDITKRVPNLTVSGDLSRPADLVVLLSSALAPTRLHRVMDGDTPEMPMLQAWKDLGLRVVAAEPSTAPVSLIPAFQRHSVSTVDNIDTPTGQAAAALALAAAEGEGDYGTRSTAQQVLPDRDRIPRLSRISGSTALRSDGTASR